MSENVSASRTGSSWLFGRDLGQARRGVRHRGLEPVIFTEASRPATLATAYSAPKPGGLILAPLLGDDDAAAAEPHGTEASNLALEGGARRVGGAGSFGHGAGRRDVGRRVADAAITPAVESPLRIVYAIGPDRSSESASAWCGSVGRWWCGRPNDDPTVGGHHAHQRIRHREHPRRRPRPGSVVLCGQARHDAVRRGCRRAHLPDRRRQTFRSTRPSTPARPVTPSPSSTSTTSSRRPGRCRRRASRWRPTTCRVLVGRRSRGHGRHGQGRVVQGQ